MKEVVINETDIVSAANEGMDSFLSLFVKSIKDSIGGELTAETMPMLNVNQITLLAYDIFHEEVMDGGFVQLIHNGYGGFIFQNPFAKVLKMWGLRDLSKLIYNGRELYFKYKDKLEKDCSDEEFMALYEKFEKYDEYDDEYVERETEYTEAVDSYIEANIDEFLTIR